MKFVVAQSFISISFGAKLRLAKVGKVWISVAFVRFFLGRMMKSGFVCEVRFVVGGFRESFY